MIIVRLQRLIIISLVCLLTTALAAQDSLSLHPDTFKLQDQPATVSDAWLLDLVAEQSRQLHEGDTIVVGDSVVIADIALLQALKRDSIRRDSLVLDSLKHVYQAPPKQHHIEGVVVDKSIIKDTEEDRADFFRAIRDMHTPWRKDILVMVQMTQNYATPNWYQGGNASFAMISNVKGTINYYRDRITWENTGDWRAGFSTVSGDSLRKINTTDDLFRWYSKFGYEIYKKIYFISSAEFETCFFPTYKANTRDLKTGPFSPVRLNIEAGIDFRPVKGLSIIVSPAAYKLVHNKNGTTNDVGSIVRVYYTYKPVREIALDARFFFFTTYKRVEMDLEVNCDFIINRFLSARVSLHPRYDNTAVYGDDDRAHVQFKELVSIGFAHKFH
ncbi:MAG: DUF3078 domain-containing protein [Paludibacteraceae bacterium]|nr:DUF3078 domain-containing protein [Paludibacteraceae bacterium]